MGVRILHLSTRLILGGSQENTVLSCEGQSSLGHEVHLAFGPIFGPEGSLLDRVRAFRSAGGDHIRTHEIADLCREISPMRDRRARGQVLRLLEAIRPDVVHTHSSKAGILGRVAAWAWNQRLPRADRCGIVHTIHGPPFMPMEGGPLTRMKTLAANALYTMAERHAARRCHAIVSVADAMTEQFLARGIGTPGLYSTVASGMEVDRYLSPASESETRRTMRESLGIEPGTFVVGTVARLAQHKGHDEILDALGDDLQSRPDWRLLWVGDGWWRDRLMDRVKRMGMEGRVLTPGLVPSERVAGYIRAMDVLVHPSRREGLPRTVPQALLCGVPVVATDVDGTREACIQGKTGILVPLDDPRAMREAVLWMYDHPDERARLAEAGRQMCRVRFSTETMVDELEKVYARAVRLARGGADRAEPRRAAPSA